ncbi:redox-sensitive transcriptional activator SoxR [Deinococcus arenae]|uniref:Redox-sensitive transcriptional activator SoxR n=1 Tax=Deinococcus arenae TaxID=1452751 RepID=A0A8H9GNG4_9DEIO|nr:redox-sensitive transcriptional activator SoxR [Deinococcus arenae]AWT36402.1 redox-sensitive transcriptional activator SoxR [Deinococcus actinosclerus]GGM39503.1 redox-sensitive transcriptional activator SoxR [Deinococcus arenae]
MPTPLTPAQLAARSGLSVPTLHHYEREGLISAARTGGNQRRYPPDTLRRLAFIRAAARVGVPLAEIRAALDTLPGGRPPSAQDWAALSATWRAALDARIATLTRLRNDLDGCIACGCLSLDRCALHNPGDALGRTLPGGSQL